MRIADLPWYDLPELQDATDTWWAGIARHLRALGVERVPETLTREGSHEARWAHPDLLLSQACGYDVLYDSVQVIAPVATPCYSAGACTGPRYHSEVVVRADRPHRSLADLRGARAVVNEATSHSGTNALRPLVAPLCRDGAFFGSVAVSGSHTDSLLMLQQDQADVACVDAVVLELMRTVRPAALRGLRTIAATAPAPAPPYVTSVHTDHGTRTLLQRALAAALRDAALDSCRRALLLTDFAVLPAQAYDELKDHEATALQAGYLELPAPRRSPLHRHGDARHGERGACATGLRR